MLPPLLPLLLVAVQGDPPAGLGIQAEPGSEELRAWLQPNPVPEFAPAPRAPTPAEARLGWRHPAFEPTTGWSLDVVAKRSPGGAEARSREAWERPEVTAELRTSPDGPWRSLRLLDAGDRVRRWLDGVELAQAAKLPVALSGEHGERRLVLSGGPGALWVGRLLVRDRSALPGKEVELFDGESLAGWRPVGDAVWTVEDGTLLGATGGGAQSFLVSERSFGDYVIEVDLRIEGTGNSGLQLRSHVDEAGRVVGYQMEVDPSERRWSGGVYDEARRGWLDDLADDEVARAALRPGEWNTFRVEHVGPWLRTWVNDVPCAELLDVADLEGHFALQVHSGQDTRVRWRDFRLRNLGRTEWQAVDLAETLLDPWVRRDWALEDGSLVAPPPPPEDPYAPRRGVFGAALPTGPVKLLAPSAALRFELCCEGLSGSSDFELTALEAWSVADEAPGSAPPDRPRVRLHTGKGSTEEAWRTVTVLREGRRSAVQVDDGPVQRIDDLPPDAWLRAELRPLQGSRLELRSLERLVPR